MCSFNSFNATTHNGKLWSHNACVLSMNKGGAVENRPPRTYNLWRNAGKRSKETGRETLRAMLKRRQELIWYCATMLRTQPELSKTNDVPARTIPVKAPKHYTKLRTIANWSAKHDKHRSEVSAERWCSKEAIVQSIIRFAFPGCLAERVDVLLH